MLDPFKDLDWKKYYIIFGMCDETFSINYSASIPDDVDQGWFLFWVTILNHIYWVAGATLGGLLGTIIPFKTDGLKFVLTALFFVIFLENWKKEKHPILYWPNGILPLPPHLWTRLLPITINDLDPLTSNTLTP